jgi:hypothetical protein
MQSETHLCVAANWAAISKCNRFGLELCCEIASIKADRMPPWTPSGWPESTSRPFLERRVVRPSRIDERGESGPCRSQDPGSLDCAPRLRRKLLGVGVADEGRLKRSPFCDAHAFVFYYVPNSDATNSATATAGNGGAGRSGLPTSPPRRRGWQRRCRAGDIGNDYHFPLCGSRRQILWRRRRGNSSAGAGNAGAGGGATAARAATNAIAVLSPATRPRKVAREVMASLPSRAPRAAPQRQ